MQKTLYLFSDGRLRRKDNTICVEGEENLKYFPVNGVRDVFIFGEVDLNKRVLEFLKQNEVILHFFDRHGYYVGSFYPREHYNSGYMILKQAEHYIDEEKRFCVAEKFVSGSLINVLQVLRYYQNRGKAVERNIVGIENLLKESLPACSTIEQLMAIEGNAKQLYYDSFTAILDKEEFEFEGRSKRPPADPLNALISFGNSLVYVKVLTEIYKTHLDPRIGFLHTTNFRRFTLNLDVAEIFKPILADRVLFTLVGRNMLSAKDFENYGGGTLLSESGRKKYVQEMENKLSSTFYHRRLKRNVSYQTLIRLELYKIEKHLIGQEEYSPFVSRW